MSEYLTGVWSPRRPRMGPSHEIGVLSRIVQKVTLWGWYRLLESGERYRASAFGLRCQDL
jgi:hypothetical protein